MITNQDEGLALLESGANVFLTGRAGTGKSFLIDLFRNTTEKRIKVTATTGIAARNVNGTTIFSALGMGLGPRFEFDGQKETINDFVGRITATHRFIEDLEPVITKWDTLIIDEISMMQGYTLQGIDGILKEAKREWDKPFGGIQIVFVGDFLQLAPVTGYNCKVDWCFQRKVWTDANLNIVNLEKIWRQDDLGFQALLNAVRMGFINNEQHALLQSRIIPIFNEDDFVLLETHNKDVDRINAERLAAIDEEEFQYYARTTGPSDEVKGLISTVIVPETLILKKGAKVMACYNDRGGAYVNGSIGIVEDLNKESVFVAFDNGTKIWVDKVAWDNAHYQADVTKRASFSQIPLRLSWACSIHKSQGLTLDQTIVNPGKCFAEGQCYVALSRVRNIENLFLRNWNNRCVKTSSEVINFYASLGF